jgi:uncharacterized protein
VSTANFIVTASGTRFYFHDMAANNINIEEIATSLSNICRFGGHCGAFYSVAQHSVMVSHLVSKEHALAALLHDATEAYVGDMVRPLKRQMHKYKEVERIVGRLIEHEFGVDLDCHEIHTADNKALYAEAMVFFGSVEDWDLDEFEYHCPIIPLDPIEARALFMKRFDELSRELAHAYDVV